MPMTANEPRGRIPADSFSNRLLLARKLAGMTIEEAAAACGFKKSSWANWENGRRPQGQIDVCTAIADALDIDREWLLFGGPLTPSARMHKRLGEATRRYPQGPVRPTDTRPDGWPLVAAGPTRSSGHPAIPPPGPGQRRSRRIK